MDQVEVEYVNGPVDGRRERRHTGPDGAPPSRVEVITERLPERWDDVHRPTPAVPPQAHSYARELLVTAADGAQLWQYHHLGAVT